MTILFNENIPYEKWSEYVLNHANGNIFQTFEMYQVYKETKNYEPFAFACIDQKENITGVLLAVIQKESKGFAGKFSSRSIIYGSPVADNNEAADALIKEYDNYIRSKAIYTQIRNTSDTSFFSNMFEQNNYNYEEHLNILVDLKKSEEILWAEVNQKRRNEIRRALKEGTTVREIVKDEEIEQSYEILKEVYAYAKLPFADKSLFFSAKKYLHKKGYIKYFGAFFEEKLIGTMYVLCYSKTMYDWYAGSYRAYYKKYPNDLVPWEIFKIGKSLEYDTFDFGGAGKPNVEYGVRDYKKKFGGQVVEFGRWQKIHQPLMFKIGTAGFKVYKKLKK